MGCFLPTGMRNSWRYQTVTLTKMNLAIIASPLGWITVVGVNVRKRDGEVNVVEVEVVKTPVLELFLRQRPDLYLKTPFSQGKFGPWKTSHDRGRGMYSRAKVDLSQVVILARGD